MSAVGLCWLRDCRATGAKLVVGEYHIVLCAEHRELLESSSSGGYSQALPPPAGQGVRTFERSNWWPWELVEKRT